MEAYMKERNYRVVETLRQQNLREQRRLAELLSGGNGLEAEKHYKIEAVAKEQRRIREELQKIRQTSSTTWGVLPSKEGNPTGGTQAKAQQTKSPSLPWVDDDLQARARKNKQVKVLQRQLAVAEHDEKSSIEDLSNVPHEQDEEAMDIIDSNEEMAPKRRRKKMKKHHSTEDVTQQSHVEFPLIEPVANKPQTKAVSFNLVESDHGERMHSRCSSSLQSPGLETVKEEEVGGGSGGNSSSRSDTETVSLTGISLSDAKGNVSKRLSGTHKKKEFTTQKSKPTPIARLNGGPPKSTSLRGTLAPIEEKEKYEHVTNIAGNGEGPTSLSKVKSSSMTALISVLRSDLVEEPLSGNDQDANDDKSQSKADKRLKKKASRLIAAKNEESSEPQFDRMKYNPDGSLRAVHSLPDLEESLKEAMKTRYLRNKFKLWYDNELTVDDIFDPDVPKTGYPLFS